MIMNRITYYPAHCKFSSTEMMLNMCADTMYSFFQRNHINAEMCVLKVCVCEGFFVNGLFSCSL